MSPLICVALLGTGLPGLVESQQSSEIVPEKLGPLIRVPCLFQDGVPTVTLKSWAGDKEVQYRLLLDTGCSQSLFLLPPGKKNPDKAMFSAAPRSVRLSLRIPNHPEDFGETAFADVDRAYFGADLLAYFDQRKIDGILGFEFFKNHDVLIDYKEKKVFLSLQASGTEDIAAKVFGEESKSYLRVPLYEYANGYRVAARLPETKSLLFLLVDTGSSITALPISAASHEKPATAKNTDLIGAKQNFSGWSEKVKVQFAPIDTPFELELWYIDESPNVLAPRDLGGQVLFSFRRSEMWVQKSTL